MKSKSSTFILIIVILVVVGVLIYFFAIKDKSAAPKTGLVSTTTGTTAVPTSSTDVMTPGAQVVALLRNLSTIQLDDAVFRNPSFALLQDLSIQLPPIVNQGRRNPFAPVGTDTFVITENTTVTPTSPTSTTSGGPSAN